MHQPIPLNDEEGGRLVSFVSFVGRTNSARLLVPNSYIFNLLEIFVNPLSRFFSSTLSKQVVSRMLTVSVSCQTTSSWRGPLLWDTCRTLVLPGEGICPPQQCPSSSTSPFTPAHRQNFVPSSLSLWFSHTLCG